MLIKNRTFRACFISKRQLETLLYAKAELGDSHYDYLYRTFINHNNAK